MWHEMTQDAECSLERNWYMKARKLISRNYDRRVVMGLWLSVRKYTNINISVFLTKILSGLADFQSKWEYLGKRVRKTNVCYRKLIYKGIRENISAGDFGLSLVWGRDIITCFLALLAMIWFILTLEYRSNVSPKASSITPKRASLSSI